MSESEQLPLPEFASILWPSGPVSLLLTLLECKRRRRAMGNGEPTGGDSVIERQQRQQGGTS